MLQTIHQIVTGVGNSCMKISNKLRILELSDVHLGHINTPTTHIVDNLMSLISRHIGDIDLLIIAGDLFDRQLNFPNPDAMDSIRFIGWLLSQCKRYDVVLRVLEGTPSHDWQQSRWVGLINEQQAIGADAKFINTLSIDYIERFDINVLYIPDEWRTTTHQTRDEVVALLQSKNIDKVDFTVMHGMFPHQLPPQLRERLETHDDEFYLDITRYLVFIGHVHQYSQHRRILSAGSFDRLTHGDEINKGMVLAHVSENGKFTAELIVNTNAMRYESYRVEDYSADEIHNLLAKLSEELPLKSYVRLLGNRDSIVTGMMSKLPETYPRLKLSFKLLDSLKKKDKVVTNVVPKQVVGIRRENIKEVFNERIKSKYPPDVVASLSHLLSEFVDE